MTQTRKAPPASRAPAKIYSIEIAGTDVEFECGESETVVEAADYADVQFDVGCRGGICATCKVRLIRGEVDQSDGEALTPREIAAGYILTCVARPKSDLVIER